MTKLAHFYTKGVTHLLHCYLVDWKPIPAVSSNQYSFLVVYVISHASQTHRTSDPSSVSVCRVKRSEEWRQLKGTIVFFLCVSLIRQTLTASRTFCLQLGSHKASAFMVPLCWVGLHAEPQTVWKFKKKKKRNIWGHILNYFRPLVLPAPPPCYLGFVCTSTHRDNTYSHLCSLCII